MELAAALGHIDCVNNLTAKPETPSKTTTKVTSQRDDVINDVINKPTTDMRQTQIDITEPEIIETSAKDTDVGSNARNSSHSGDDVNGVNTNILRRKRNEGSVNRDRKLLHTALVSAVEHNQIDCAKMLVEAGADVNARRSFILAEAARTGHHQCLEVLLNRATMKVDIDASDSNRPSPLIWAVGKGHICCAKLLLKSGANVNQALMEAIRNGDKEIAGVLFDLGASENLKETIGSKFFSYLLKKGCQKCLETIARDGDTDTPKVFRTLLKCSTEKGNLECIKKVIDAGADVNTRLKKGNTAVMLAAKYGFDKSVDYFISRGADVNMVDHEHFETPLLKAAFHMNYECARKLLLAGAVVNTGSSKNEALFRTTANKTMVLLLHAAGEIVIIDDTMLTEFASDVYSDSNKLTLKHQCRRTIRYQLMEVSLYKNLIVRVQKLGLPKSLVQYLLFDQPIFDNTEKKSGSFH